MIQLLKSFFQETSARAASISLTSTAVVTAGPTAAAIHPIELILWGVSIIAALVAIISGIQKILFRIKDRRRPGLTSNQTNYTDMP